MEAARLGNREAQDILTSLGLSTEILFNVLKESEKPTIIQENKSINEIEHLKTNALRGDVSALTELGVKYATGQGVAKDIKQAIYLFTPAAEKGDVYAQFNLGMIYANDLGGFKNRDEAIKWLTKAAKQGHELATIKLEVLLKEEKPDTQFFLG
jgi:TPR repeat protein